MSLHNGACSRRQPGAFILAAREPDRTFGINILDELVSIHAARSRERDYQRRSNKPRILLALPQS